MSESSGNVALFDFDGTLIPCDSQILFAGFVMKKHPWRRWLMLFYALALPLACFGRWGETRLKRLFLVYLWKLKRDEIEQLAEEFYEVRIKPILYAPLIDELRTHQENRDLCVLATASPSVYAGCIGRKLGFDVTLCTDVEYRDVFPLCPALPFGNNKGETKVERLRDMGMIGGETSSGRISSYTDSMADEPMLRIAGRRTLVNPSRRLAGAWGEDSRIFTLPRLWSTVAGKLRFIAGIFWGVY